jgi:DNA invertase Pin-like site-specific DNA recombinase
MSHAHLYGRVSDPNQTAGHGLARQQNTALVEEFCTRHGFDLAKKVWVDDGVSAFSGLNASPHHELGKFLAKAQGRVAVRPGDCLLIENYDRLSRQNPWAAISLINELRNLQIHVGRLDTMRLLRYDSEDSGDFFEAAVEFTRGHSESKMKADRLRKLRLHQREQARSSGKVAPNALPAWLHMVDGQPQVIPEREKAIHVIFELAAQGHGLRAILSHLQAHQVPPFQLPPKRDRGKRMKGAAWKRSYLGRLLRDRRLLGEYQPHRYDRQPGQRREWVTDGEPIPGYFPVVVSKDEWDKASNGLLRRRSLPGRPAKKRLNLFAGLLHNPLGGTWHCNSRSRDLPPALVNSESMEQCGAYLSFPYAVFETEVLRHLREIKPADVVGKNSAATEVLRLSGELETVRHELAEIAAYLKKHKFKRTVADHAEDLERREAELLEQLEVAEAAAAHPPAQAWGEQSSVLKAWQEEEDRAALGLRLQGLLRETIAGIWLLVVRTSKVSRVAAVQIWFSGGAKQRSYVILHESRVARKNGERPERCWSRSFAQAGLEADAFDLRRRDHAEDLARALAELVELPDVGNG